MSAAVIRALERRVEHCETQLYLAEDCRQQTLASYERVLFEFCTQRNNQVVYELAKLERESERAYLEAELIKVDLKGAVFSLLLMTTYPPKTRQILKNLAKRRQYLERKIAMCWCRILPRRATERLAVSTWKSVNAQVSKYFGIGKVRVNYTASSWRCTS